MATFYISTTGNDSTGDGSSGNPWLTVAKFLSASASGDTLLVGDGTFTISSMTITNRTIQGLNYLTNPGGAILDGGGINCLIEPNSGTVLRGLKIQNIVANQVDQIFRLIQTDVTGYTIDTCILTTLKGITGAYGYAIFSSANGIASGASITIKNTLFNDVQQNTGSRNGGIFGFHSGTLPLTLQSCVFYFKSAGITGIRGVFDGDNIVNLTMKNCIFYNDTGVTISYNVGGATLNNTSNLTNDYYLMTGMPAVTSGVANLTADPLFVDVSNSNFNLRPTSPCIDTGTL